MRDITEYNYKNYYVIDRLFATSQKHWLTNFKLNRLVTKTIKEHAKTKRNQLNHSN